MLAGCATVSEHGDPTPRRTRSGLRLGHVRRLPYPCRRRLRPRRPRTRAGADRRRSGADRLDLQAGRRARRDAAGRAAAGSISTATFPTISAGPCAIPPFPDRPITLRLLLSPPLLAPGRHRLCDPARHHAPAGARRSRRLRRRRTRPAPISAIRTSISRCRLGDGAGLGRALRPADGAAGASSARSRRLLQLDDLQRRRGRARRRALRAGRAGASATISAAGGPIVRCWRRPAAISTVTSPAATARSSRRRAACASRCATWSRSAGCCSTAAGIRASRFLREESLATMFGPEWRFDGEQWRHRERLLLRLRPRACRACRFPRRAATTICSATAGSMLGHAGDAYGVRSGLWIDLATRHRHRLFRHRQWRRSAARPQPPIARSRSGWPAISRAEGDPQSPPGWRSTAQG